MDMDDDNDDSDVILVEVKPRKKFVKRVMGDAEEGDINGKTSSILKTAEGDARARVKKKVDEGKSKIKAAESDEEQQAEEERKTEIESRITQETHVNEENQNHSRRVQLRFR